jgi:hypothetical protein
MLRSYFNLNYKKGLMKAAGTIELKCCHYSKGADSDRTFQLKEKVFD